MAQEIRVPRLGWSMEEGTFVRWLKRDGEPVQVGEALYELEGEKATQEIEAVDAGFLRIPPAAPPPGTVVLVGALLGYLGAAEELAPWEMAAEGQAAPDVVASLAAPQGTSATGPSPQPSARSGEQNDVPATRRTSSPRARRMAAELGVDWSQLAGSGRNGRVREADVRSVAGTGVKLSSRRRTIADRMLASTQRTAPVTLTTRADATNLVELRAQAKAQGQTAPAFTDILAFLAARVLGEHPHVASRWNEAGDSLQAPAGLHIGIAVDTDQGLIVPVLRNVGELTLEAVAAQSRDLIERVRQGQLSSAELSGGVFTITNLGSFGIDAFTPIINYPETAILGVGAIRREPVFLDNDRVAARNLLTLSLTFDHRAYDGAPAARFLQSLVRAIETAI